MTRTQERAALIVLALTVACGGPTTYNLAPASTESTVKSAPKWFLEPPQQEDRLTAASTATSRDLQIAVDKALTQAQADIAQQLGTRLMDLTNRFQEEAGVGESSTLLSQFSSATKAVTDETLAGVRTRRTRVRAEGDVYRAYVLVELPLAETKRLLLGRLQGEQALYSRFRATEAYADLDEEVRRYEQWRAEHR